MSERITEVELREIEQASRFDATDESERLAREVRRLRGLIVRTHGGRYEAAANLELEAEAEAIRGER